MFQITTFLKKSFDMLDNVMCHDTQMTITRGDEVKKNTCGSECSPIWQGAFAIQFRVVNLRFIHYRRRNFLSLTE